MNPEFESKRKKIQSLSLALDKMRLVLEDEPAPHQDWSPKERELLYQEMEAMKTKLDGMVQTLMKFIDPNQAPSK